jgi:hypothetical protein
VEALRRFQQDQTSLWRAPISFVEVPQAKSSQGQEAGVEFPSLANALGTGFSLDFAGQCTIKAPYTRATTPRKAFELRTNLPYCHTGGCDHAKRSSMTAPGGPDPTFGELLASIDDL